MPEQITIPDEGAQPDPLAALPPAEPPAPRQDDALPRVQEELNRTKEEIRRMQQAMMVRPPIVTGPPPPQPKKEDIDMEFLKDPVTGAAAVATHVAQQTEMRLMAQMYPSMRAAAIEQARAADPVLFDRMRGEIEARVNQLAPQFHTQPGIWQEAFNATKGVHLRELMEEVKVTPQQRAAADGPAPPSRRPAPAPRGAAAELTDEERRYARRFGMDEERYRKGKERVEAQADSGKSTWDDFMVFNEQGLDAWRKRKAEAKKRRFA